MVADPRAKHLKRLHRLRRSARGWSIRAGLLVGATAVLVPYSGLGLADAFWAAAAGGSVALTFWRWADLRAFAALPVPEALPPAAADAQVRTRLRAAVSRLPLGSSMVQEYDRQRSYAKLRSLAVADHWRRLDRAAAVLGSLVGRLDPPAEAIVLDAAVAERALRDLAERTAAIERAMRLSPENQSLAPTHAALMRQLDDGVSAYERLVAAAADCVAESGTPVGNLADSTEFLRGFADALASLRTTTA